jgi:outer membrane protein assembly factor BamD
MNSTTRRRFLAGCYLLFLLIISGCASLDFLASKPVEPLSNSDRELMSQAEAAITVKNYDEGRKHLQRLINHFPESELVPVARLNVGRSYFDEKRYDEARVEYQRLLELFPQHELLDEAQYYMGLSYFYQMEKTDRDQTMTKKAIREFQALVSEFRNSQFVPDAQARLTECHRRIVQRELYVGKFYFNREAYGAAIPRLESVLKEYPRSEYNDQVLFYLGESLWELEQKEQAKAVYQRLIAEFPDSDMAPPAAQRIGLILARTPREHKPSPGFLGITFTTMADALAELTNAILDSSVWQSSSTTPP